MKMIKKLVTILLSVIFALALCACANGNDKPTDETDAGQEKELVWRCYTLKHAYENNWITKDDLLDIAYYYDQTSIVHDASLCDKGKVTEIYEPKLKTPEELDEQTFKALFKAYLEFKNVKNPERYRIEDSQTYCLGEYNNCIAAIIDCFGGIQWNWSDMVGGVLFNYPSGPIEIHIWRKTI